MKKGDTTSGGDEDLFAKLNKMTNEELLAKLKELIDKKEYDSEEAQAIDAILAKRDQDKRYEEARKKYEERKAAMHEEVSEIEKGKIKLLLPGPGVLDTDFAAKLGDIYANKRKFFYDIRTGKVVRIALVPANPLSRSSSKKVLGLEEVTKEAFVSMIEEEIVTGKEKKIMINGIEMKVFVKQSLDPGKAGIILQDFKNFVSKLPVIEEVLSFPMPYLVDGKLYLPRKGYDEITHTWLDPNAPEIDPNMPLDEALHWLEDIHSEFAFYSNIDTNREEEKRDADKINSYAKLITPMLRGMYSHISVRTPLYIVKANQPRVGKDYLCDITQIVYTGQAYEFPPISTNEGTDETELKKLIMGILLSGERFFHSSNNEGKLYSAILEQLATNETFADRVLGSNKNVSLPNILEISLSANMGLTYSLDLQERSIIINLFYPKEDPNKRIFKRQDLHGYIRQHRAEILSAIYTLIRNWYEKGMPLSKKPFASFPEWMAICGGVMEAAGLKAPVFDNDVMDTVGANPEIRDVRRLFELGFEASNKALEERGSRALTRSELVEIVKNNDLFSYMKWNTNEQSAKIKLFKLLNGKYRRMIFQINGKDVRLDVIEQTNSTRNEYIFVDASEMQPEQEQTKLQQNNENSQNTESTLNTKKDDQQNQTLYGCIDCNSPYTSTLNFLEEEKNIHNNNKIYNLYTYTNQPPNSNNLLDTLPEPKPSPQPEPEPQPSPEPSPSPAPQVHEPDSPSFNAQAQAAGSIAQPAKPVLDTQAQASRSPHLLLLALYIILHKKNKLLC